MEWSGVGGGETGLHAIHPMRRQHLAGHPQRCDPIKAAMTCTRRWPCRLVFLAAMISGRPDDAGARPSAQKPVKLKGVSFAPLSLSGVDGSGDGWALCLTLTPASRQSPEGERDRQKDRQTMRHTHTHTHTRTHTQ